MCDMTTVKLSNKIVTIYESVSVNQDLSGILGYKE